MSYTEEDKRRDFISRGNKNPNPLGTGLFVGLRALDPFLQYGILAQGFGSTVIEKLGGHTLPHGPSLITNTVLDRLGLSPYRLILLSMAAGSAIKQNLTILTITHEEMPPASSVMVSAFNTVLNSVNDLLFVCSATSASVNGEHFPQTPLLVGSTLYAVGILTEMFSELQRKAFKNKPENKGKVYKGGLFSLSRHINYFGYTLWRSGYALAAGGWTWGAIVGTWFTYDFLTRGIPVLNDYCEDRVGSSVTIVSSCANTACSMANSGSTISSKHLTSLRLSCTRTMQIPVSSFPHTTIVIDDIKVLDCATLDMRSPVLMVYQLVLPCFAHNQELRVRPHASFEVYICTVITSAYDD